MFLESIAAFLGWSPQRFWHSSVRDLQIALEADRKRQRHEMERLAQLGAWILTPWSRRPVRAMDLLPPERPARDSQREKDDFARRLAQVVAGDRGASSEEEWRSAMVADVNSSDAEPEKGVRQP